MISHRSYFLMCMIYFDLVFSRILEFIAYAFVGVVAVKLKVLDKAGLNVVSRLVMKISLPVMVFVNVVNGSSRAQLKETGIILVLTIIMYFALFFLCWALARGLRLKGTTGRVFRAGAMFGNVGFIGIPIIMTLFPNSGMLYIALFSIIDQALLWTLGLELSSPAGENKKISVQDFLKKITNPAMMGIVLALIMILADIQLPAKANDILTKIGSTTTPLALIYLGGLFLSVEIGKCLCKRELYVLVLVKMILFPIVLYVLLRLTGILEEVCVAFCILSALPTMASAAMFAGNQKSDEKYAAGMILFTHLFSIASLPTVCFAIQCIDEFA